MDTFDPRLTNGHDLLNPEWQRTVEELIQRTATRSLRLNNDSSDQSSETEESEGLLNDNGGAARGGWSGGGVGRDLFGLRKTNNASSSEPAVQMQSNANVEKVCTVLLSPEMDENGDCAAWMSSTGSGSMRKVTVSTEHLVGLDELARAWIEDLNVEMLDRRQLGEARVTLHGLSQRPLPLYYYAVRLNLPDNQWANNSRGYVPTAFVRNMQYWCAPLTQVRLLWLVRHSIPDSRYEAKKGRALVKHMWGSEQETGSVAWSVKEGHCLERTFEYVETRWREACASTTTSAANTNPSTSAVTPETQIATAIAEARPENLGKNTRDWLLDFLNHPEVVRYFGGDSMRRLARYWPLQWLMGLDISHNGGMTDEKGRKRDNQLQCLERMLCEDPARFCTANSRPQNILSREYQSTSSAFGACKSGAAPVLNLEQVMRACVDYKMLDSDGERVNHMLMDLFVNQIMRHTYYTKFHKCCDAMKLLKKVKKYLNDLLNHYSGLAKPSPVLWHPPRVRATTEYDYGDGETGDLETIALATDEEEQIEAVQINMQWFNIQPTLRAIQSAGRLCSSQYQGALVPCMQGVSRDELLDRMQTGRFCGEEELKNLWFYVRESHDTEAMLLYGAYRICNQASFIAQRDGPMMLQRIPPGMSCCSEQLAFLRYALGYDINGQHTVGCEAFANAQGRGGAGKTQLLELLCHVLGDSREMLVLAYQGSHIANVERRFPHMRAATIRMFIHKHFMLCTRTLQRARSTMSMPKYKQFAAMVTKLRECMVSNAKSWQTDHAEENRSHYEAARADGMPLGVDEKQRREYGSEAFTYGMPYKECPLERIKVVVLEEFGMTPEEDIALLINILPVCCPQLRCIVTMGDKHQLFPISPGHIQKSFLEGFGWIQFDHSHRQGEGCLSQLARAMQTQDPDLLRFDNKTAQLIECDQDDMLKTLRDVSKFYGLTPYMSQIIARTNATRIAINAAMKPYMYPTALSVQGALNAPIPPWKRHLSSDRHQLEQLQKAAREYDALEKINYKLNMPSLGLCNNGMYIVWCALVLNVQRKPMDQDGTCDAYGMPLKNSSRNMSMKQWQAEANRAAAQNEQESLVAAQLMAVSRDSSNSLSRDFYGTLMGIDSEMALAPPLCLTDEPVIKLEPAVDVQIDPDVEDIMNQLMADMQNSNNLNLRSSAGGPLQLLPTGLFNTDCPSLDNGPGTRPMHNVKVRLPRAALVALLKAMQGKVPDDVASSMYDITIDRVLRTTMDPPNMNSGELSVMHARTILLCTPFRDDMDITKPVDQHELLYVPFTPEKRGLIQPALCVTGHCMQGNQSTCVIFVVPYCSRYDTCNYGYTAFTRALYNAHRQEQLKHRGKRPHPSLIVLGKMEALRRMALKSEPERMSHTGRLLRMVRDITCKKLPPMDYDSCAFLEHQEAGKFGKRDEPFISLYAEQLNVSEEQALEIAKTRAESNSLESLLHEEEDEDDEAMYQALLELSNKRKTMLSSDNSRSSDDGWLTDIPAGMPLRVVYEESSQNSMEAQHKSKRRTADVQDGPYRVHSESIGEMYQADKPCAFDIDFSMPVGK